MTADAGVLGIIYWTDETDNKIHYRCRGTGLKYNLFYEWLKVTSYKCTSSDWPWDFFIFEDPIDDDAIKDVFGEYLMDDED